MTHSHLDSVGGGRRNFGSQLFHILQHQLSGGTCGTGSGSAPRSNTVVEAQRSSRYREPARWAGEDERGEGQHLKLPESVLNLTHNHSPPTKSPPTQRHFRSQPPQFRPSGTPSDLVLRRHLGKLKGFVVPPMVMLYLLPYLFRGTETLKSYLKRDHPRLGLSLPVWKEVTLKKEVWISCPCVVILYIESSHNTTLSSRGSQHDCAPKSHSPKICRQVALRARNTCTRTMTPLALID